MWNVRSTGTAPRAWGHGSYSGAEWLAERIVPIRLMIDTPSEAEFWDAVDELAAAFRPIGEDIQEVELRYHRGGRERVLFGRPRMGEPELSTAPGGTGFVQLGFVALDPFKYSAEETVTGPITGPVSTGGLSLSFSLPTGINARLVGGFADLVNEGTADAPLRLRIDGPDSNPWVALQRADGLRVLRFNIAIAAGQWLDVDTAAKKVFLNGVSSVRGDTSSDGGPWPLLPPKSTTRLRYFGDGSLTIRHRSVWY
jgi:hypothetical protein